MEIRDPAVRSAVAEYLGHKSPCSDFDVRSIKGPLVIIGAKRLDDVAALTGLEDLSIIAAADGDMAPISRLAGLRRLRVLATPARSLDALSDKAPLEEVDISFTLVSDITKVLAYKGLRRARFVGLPLDDQSIKQATKASSKISVDLSPPAQRKVMHQLAQKGLEVCWAEVSGAGPLLIRPGRSKQGGVDFLRANEDDVLLDIDSFSGTTDDYWALFDVMREQGAADGSVDLTPRLEAGTAEDAKGWIKGSQLDEKRQAALSTFVTHFGGMTFAREDGRIIASVEREQGVKFGPWLTELRKTLAFILPVDGCEVRFSSFEGDDSPRADEVGKIWYAFGLRKYLNEDQQSYLKKGLGVFPVGYWLKTGLSTLAIAIDDPADTNVYEFTEADVWDAVADGESATECMHRVFSSYESMLAHIDAIRIPGDGEVKAKRSGQRRVLRR